MIICENAGVNHRTKGGQVVRSQKGTGPGIFTLSLLLFFLLINFILFGDQWSLVSGPQGGISATSRSICSRVNNYSWNTTHRHFPTSTSDWLSLDQVSDLFNQVWLRAAPRETMRSIIGEMGHALVKPLQGSTWKEKGDVEDILPF